MVAQDEGSSASHGEKADLSQQRKSLMAAAIRRGEVKISEPILWVEGVPSNQQTVSPVVKPQVAGTADAAEGSADAGADAGGEEQHPIHGLAISTDEAAPVVQNHSRDGSSIAQQQSVLSSGVREGVVSQATVIPATPTGDRSEHKRSIFVEDEMATPSPTAMEKKKARRSGTLRTVLRSVFGRKKKRQSQLVSPPPSRAGRKHEHSRSVSIIFRCFEVSYLACTGSTTIVEKQALASLGACSSSQHSKCSASTTRSRAGE